MLSRQLGVVFRIPLSAICLRKPTKLLCPLHSEKSSLGHHDTMQGTWRDDLPLSRRVLAPGPHHLKEWTVSWGAPVSPRGQ
jgi:hypothetical protein